MADPAALAAEQDAYWNGMAGQEWVRNQAHFDGMMAGIADHLLARAAPAPGEIVLDIGCGAGATTAALVNRVGPTGQVFAIDISEPLLAATRERLKEADNVTFMLCDAGSAALDGIEADLLVSRFGVMFFAEPTPAFRNLRRGLRTGARLAMACWMPPTENPWMMVPLQAAYRHLPPLPEQAPTDPGPFAFADPQRVRGILEQAPFGEIEFERLGIELDLANGRGIETALDFVMRIGPASRALAEQTPETRQAVAQSVEEVLRPYVSNGHVRLPASVWMVTAVAA